MYNVKNSSKKTNSLIYRIQFIRKIMTDMNQQQPLNYRLLTWGRHIKNVAVLKPPLTWDNNETAKHKNKL